MKLQLATALAAGIVVSALSGCGSPNAAVATSGFRFADYDYVVVEKPEAGSSALYGMDVGLANLLESHGFTVIGNKVYDRLGVTEQRRTLGARLALVSNTDKKNLVAVSFEEALTGRTALSVSEVAKGDIYDNGDRKDVFAKLSKAIEAALKPETAALNAKLVARSDIAAKLATSEKQARAQEAARAEAAAAAMPAPLPAPVAEAPAGPAGVVGSATSAAPGSTPVPSAGPVLVAPPATP